MDHKKIAELQEDVFSRLKTHLPDGMSYHDLAHTRDEVIPAAELLCSLVDISENEQIQVLVAALLHDIGYMKQYSDNEASGAAMAAGILTEFDYSPIEIDIIIQLINDTKMPQQPSSRLSEILCDADLATLGQRNYYQKSLLLWQELNFFGRKISKEQWYKDQYNFLKNHQYFTLEARSLWDAGKSQNIAMLARVLRTEACVLRKG